jgi:lysine 2-monooxygenase
MLDDGMESCDIAIVGAGVAGLYTAWRLLRSSEPEKRPKIVIFESATRIGGRLKTSSIEFLGKKIIVEEGGMRFLKSHKHLMRLLEDLGLDPQIRKFGMGDENNRYYLRGESFTRGHAKKKPGIWGKIYSLSKRETGKSPFRIVEGVMRKVTKPYRGTRAKPQSPLPDEWKPENPFTWTRFRQMEYPFNSGLRVYQWGFRALLEELELTNECVQMLMDTGGFSIPYEDMVGAGSGLQLIASFPDNPDFYTLSKGYEELPRKIGSEIEKLGGDIRRTCAVHRVERDGNWLQLGVKGRGEPAIRALKVILAVPVIPMGNILRNSRGMKSAISTAQTHLKKIVHMPLTKINLYFENDWWQAKKIKNGGCFTDLPLSQVYFFRIDAVDDNRAFTGITIYSDGRRGNYWRQLQELGADYRHKTKHSQIKADSNLVVCKEIVVRHAMRQLREMFGLSRIPAPLFATISKWGEEGLGEGDHQWAVGANDEAIRKELVEIDRGLYLCGEAISDYQDWVEGALRSSDLVLQRGFNLAPYLS